ncbi:MAG: PAS domain S-box protein, partial [Cyanobacteria bacterium]|nr:PAS domain S-box protein [Cyanobacteriota bacterium]MDW8202173.1 PAS domain S-box protein [Cyanobacteriota bacterium SKYGB_h_bin112]
MMNSFSHQRQRVRILVVCSGLLAAQGLLAILRHGNYDIEVCDYTTQDCQPRMLRSSDQGFDLVMLDAMLSNSYQWCREVRSLGITLPIVFFSTGDTSPEVTQVYSAGGSDYVTTPFSQQEVLSRLKTHLELRQLQCKFNQLFVANPVAMAISTLEDGRLLEVNPAFAKLTGYTLEELLGKSTLDLNIWADRNDRNRIVQALLTKQPVLDQEIQGQTRTGEPKTVLLSSELIDHEGKTCLFSRAIDITDRKQVDVQRQRQLEMYTLLNSISRQLLNQDPDTAIHFTLKAIGEFTASDRVNIIQKDANQITLSMTHEWCIEGIEPCMALVQAMKPEACPWVMQQLLTGEPLEIQCLADLPPEASRERDLMREAGVKSTIIVPMVNGETIAGYLSADAVRAERRWMPEDIKLFSLVGELIAIAQARYAAEETQRFYLHAVSHDLRNPVVGMSMIVKNLLSQRTTGSASEP